MEIKDLVEQALGESENVLTKSLQNLTPEELAWQPRQDANNIGLILWHMFRIEDLMIRRFIQHKPELYETQSWYQKFGTDMRETGWRYSLEQLQSFSVPPLSELLDYGKAVRRETIQFLHDLPLEKLEEVPRPERPEQTIGERLRHLIIELTLHAGQIAYLRGLQRGLNQ